MDPNANPLNPTPDQAGPAPAPAPTGGTADPIAELGNLANELNGYDATAELAAMANNPAPATPADPSLAAPAPAGPMPGTPDLVMNPAAAAAPAVPTAAGELPETPTIGQPSADLVASMTSGASVAGVAPQTPNLDNANLTNLAAPTADPNTAALETPDFSANPNPAPTDPAAPIPGTAPQVEAPAGPVQAAAPVPGSIGSYKSYADIQRAQAERQAKAAAAAAAKQNGKKFDLNNVKIGGKPVNKTTLILLAAIGAIAVIGIIVLIIVLATGSSNNNSKKPSTATPAPKPAIVETTLVCQKNLTVEEYGDGWGVLNAVRTNTFTFTNDTLSTLENKFAYNMDSPERAQSSKEYFDSEHPWANQSNGELDEDEELDEDTAPTAPADDEVHLEYVTTAVSDSVYVYTEHITEDNIEAWLDSDSYKDSDYGLKITDKKNPESDRTPDGYQEAQEALGYKCTVE